MKINKSDLGKIAKNFLASLDRENIKDLYSVASRLGQSISIENNGASPDELIFDTGFSEAGTDALLIDYCRNNVGIPIEGRFNLALRYSRVTVKCAQELKEHEPFSRDKFENIVQVKNIPVADLAVFRKELEGLTALL